MTIDDRLNSVYQSIEMKLDEELTVDELCRMAHISRYHFHRLWTATFGIGVMTFVRRLRLKKAAYRIAYRQDDSITHIALDSGYDSPEAFCRSFRKHFGRSPRDFRIQPDFSDWTRDFEPSQSPRRHRMTVEVNLVTLPSIPLAVLPHRGHPAYLAQSLQTFIAWRKTHGLSPADHRTFNLIYDDPHDVPAEDFRFDLACELPGALPDNSPDMESYSIPAGHYAKVRAVGNDKQLESVVRSLYADWLPESGHEPADFPLIFERISVFPDVPEHEMMTDVYLALQP